VTTLFVSAKVKPAQARAPILAAIQAVSEPTLAATPRQRTDAGRKTMRDLDGKVAFLTGAGRGVGVGIAVALAKAGASIGLFGRTRATLEATAAKVADLGCRTVICVGDVAVRADVDKAVAQTQSELGPIWALVNNAYAAERTLIEDITDEILDEACRVCIYGAVYTMQACFPTMKERGGRIINFGSGGSTMGLPELGAYNIVKEGVRGLTKTAAVGWGQYGITVNNLCPLAPSDAYQTWFENILDDEGRRKHLAGIPLRRMGDAETDIGSVVVFLAGPGGGYITSRTLHLDGGNCYYDR
jgi:NAD(P)-dependent dehydrogenase (short-subunit alcohol dehydrogenase family)